MIKKFKIYKESIKTSNIKIGYFVIMETDVKLQKLKIFLKNNIGQIIYFDNNNVIVKYNNIPDKLQEYFNLPNSNKYSFCYNGTITELRTFGIDKIIEISEFKEDLEIYINAVKYNI